MTSEPRDLDVVALAGGVGGARLVDGLDRVLPPQALTVVVNTGDDFRHWGLRISPDLDTVMYTLAGLAPEERGWGIEGDTFRVLAEAERRGTASWFRLGDADLVTHLDRTAALASGRSLTEVTSLLCERLGVRRPILPMSDLPEETIIETTSGLRLAFQDWLVRQRARPPVARVHHEGSALATDRVLQAIDRADLVIICPSNPFVSIDPILGLQHVRQRLRAQQVVAVSPLIGGSAVKGPLASMVREIEGKEPSAVWVAEHYADILDTLFVHSGDGFSSDLEVVETDILIQARRDRVALARVVLQHARNHR